MILFKRRHCPHSTLRGIYGDEAAFNGGWRLQCMDCGSFLFGPVKLAKIRNGEERVE